MIELFQITGSCSFAARAALEEIGCKYTTVDIHPRRRDEIPDFAEVNPLQRVPALREGPEEVYETGAVLLYLGDRFPADNVAPQSTDPQRGAYLRWLFWLSNTLHAAWWPVARNVDGADDRMRAPRGVHRAASSATAATASATASPWRTSTSTCSSAGARSTASTC